MENGEMGWCKNCKYKEFYKKFSAIAEYVEKEAEKKLNKLLREGKLRKKMNCV